MKEIQDIVNAQVNGMIESGEIQRQVKEGVKKAIESAISKQFESYGNITKQLDDAFKKDLLIDSHSLDIPSLNAVMTSVVNSNINQFYKGQAADKLHALMKEKLEPLPNEMSMVDFIDLICKEWREDSGYSSEDFDEEATIEECDRLSGHGLLTFKIWKNKNSYGRENSPDVNIVFSESRENKGVWRLQGRHGSTSPYYLFDVDALIFKAYAQGVRFTGVSDFDPDDCDLQLKSYDC